MSGVAPPDLPKLHDREYLVSAYQKAPDQVLIRGEVIDTKPPGSYVEEDPDPLRIHHMVVDLTVQYPTLEIVEAEVVMETHPHDDCPKVGPTYQALVGLSIARGFTHKVRELFGGPRGCTHTTALLQAMAPVAHQSVWSMRNKDGGELVELGRKPTPAELRERMRFNLNTCHVWSDDGPMFAMIDEGEEPPPPLWAQERLDRYGVTVEQWRARMRGQG